MGSFYVQRSSARASMATVTEDTRTKVLRIARKADRLTNNRQAMTQLHHKLQELCTEKVDTAVKRAVHLQNILMLEYLAGPMRKPKVVAPESLQEKIYARAAEEAAEVLLFGCELGAQVLASGSDDQRCAVNLGADAWRLGTNGGLGAQAVGFVNVVRTSGSDKMVTLQAQGPKSPRQVADLIAAATRHATDEGCSRVVFVNASTDKVPSFRAAVERAKLSGLQLRYAELNWIDGEVPETPEGRRRIVDFVNQLSRDILAYDGKTLVVFNCHIGLDRSGITNALTQVMVDHRRGVEEYTDKEILAAASCALRNIKQARPHGVSTVFRWDLILRCLGDLCGSSDEACKVSP